MTRDATSAADWAGPLGCLLLFVLLVLAMGLVLFVGARALSWGLS